MSRVTYTFDEPIILPSLTLADMESKTVSPNDKFCQACLCTAGSTEECCPNCGATLSSRMVKDPKPGMIRIPAGSYVQGVSDEDAKRLLAKAEASHHTHGYWFFRFQIEALQKTGFPHHQEVYLPAFDIDTYPVTNAQYAAFCRTCNYPHHDKFPQQVQDIPDHPVVNVTWIDALCYALWAGKRLPTAAEWQKSARGSQDDRLYPWGNEWDRNRSKNHDSWHLNSQQEPTTPVDFFTSDPHDGRSPYGVCDLVGNVMEWVSDKNDEHMRIRCGGAWLDIGEVFCTVASVKEAYPSQSDQATGFRCASDIVYDDLPVSSDLGQLRLQG